MSTSDQKYRIIDKLDSGGMAEIFRAEAEFIQGMKKKVAIKRILPHLTQNEKFVAMFLDEARLSLHLNHANIVHVYDIGRSGQTYFIVMEYVDGLNLRGFSDSLRRQHRSVPLEHTLFLMMEVCKGLGYAHDMTSPDDPGRSLGIVHRDVSPPNILISRNGEVKLADFGLAKAASQLEHTDPGIVKGKFSYLSPEAASGLEVDYRADIFACGIILYEMLTGRRLFYGETDYQTVELVRQARVPSLTTLNPEIPAELDEIVRKSLARDPDDRYQHAYELQDALAQFLFARGLKVTSRDVARLVRRCLAEHEQTIPPKARTQGVIDHLIQEEIVKFTSLDNTSDYDDNTGAKPLSPDDIGGSGAFAPRDLIDPRDWTNEFGGADTTNTKSSPSPARQKIAPPLVDLSQRMGTSHQFPPMNGETAQLPRIPPSKLKKSAKAAWVALIVFVALGASTVIVLLKFGLLR